MKQLVLSAALALGLVGCGGATHPAVETGGKAVQIAIAATCAAVEASPPTTKHRDIVLALCDGYQAGKATAGQIFREASYCDLEPEASS